VSEDHLRGFLREKNYAKVKTLKEKRKKTSQSPPPPLPPPPLDERMFFVCARNGGESRKPVWYFAQD
jgi:hypothetical protein